MEGFNNTYLKGNPRRRSSATIRGFLYQFWRTVEAWLDLDPEEMLYVEGAEDFDLIGTDEATAVQVKDNKASGALTLNSGNALVALTNFWKLKQANQGRKIRFNFITTAQVGFEKDGFSGQKGIEIWNLCRQSPPSVCSSDVSRIRNFLQKRESLETDLANFLKQAPVEAIQQELIAPFEWLCNQPSLDDVSEIVIGRLIKMGETQGLTVNDARQLAKDLCIMVAKTALAKPPQSLTFIDLREQIDRAVNVEVPRETLRRKQKCETLMEQVVNVGLKTNGTKLPSITQMADSLQPPVLGKRIWRRSNLIERIRSALSNGVAYVVGSTGMGKTTLVRLSLEDKKRILWAGLRNFTTYEMVKTIQILEQEITCDHTSPTVVLDDLNPNGDPRILENYLGRLVTTVRAKQGWLVIISYQQAGPRLASILGLSSNSQINVSPFVEEEVRGFLISQGCQKERAKELGRVVWMSTSGHPQLVAARIVALAVAGFPKPSFNDILQQPKEIRDARTEALNIVRSILPKDARSLLYRLSIFIPSFRRSHVLRLGLTDSQVNQVGEMFDNLVGPWLEQIGQDQFRVSALVTKVGEQVLSPKEIKQLHADIATALLAEGKMSVNEFSGVIIHALAGEAEAQLAIATKVFLTSTQEIKEMLANRLSWVAAAGVEPSTNLRISNKTVRQFFRLFQWEVAGLAAPEYLKPLAESMEVDFTSDSNNLADILPKILYLSKLLLQMNYEIPPDKIVKYMLDIWRLNELARSQNAGVDFEGLDIQMYPGLKRTPLDDMFAIALLCHVHKVDDLHTLIESLDVLDSKDRQRLLDVFKTDNGELRILFNGPWLSIKSDEEKSYEDYSDILKEAISAGHRWKHFPWMRAAARALSAVLDEMLDQREEAERIIIATAKEVGPSLNLDEQLAVIAFNHKEYAKALKIWQIVIPKWKSDKIFYDMQPVFGTRCAAIAAAHLGKWSISADIFRQAIKRANIFNMRPWKVGLLGDYGYALWRSGEHKKAVVVFSKAVEELEKLPNTPESFSEYAVRKLLGHTLSAIVNQSGTLATPIPGMCSKLDPDIRIKELPPTPDTFIWYSLHTLASKVGNTKLEAQSVEKLRTAPFAFLRFEAALATLKHKLKLRRLNGIISLTVKMALELEKSNKRKEIPPHLPDPDGLSSELQERLISGLIRTTLFIVIMRAKALGKKVTILIEKWRNDIPPNDHLLLDEVDSYFALSSMGADQLSTILKNIQELPQRRLLAGILLLGRDDSTPEDALYAQVIVIEKARTFELLMEVAGESFCGLVRKDWQSFCDKRFLLRSPNLYVDSIRKACDFKKLSWSAGASIILAAYPTVALNLPKSILENIKQMAESN